jgi:hypothetical protein
MAATDREILVLAEMIESGDARVVGSSVCGCGVHDGLCYIVENLLDYETVHVRECDRPSWTKYLPRDE